jgi:hypothetical protein
MPKNQEKKNSPVEIDVGISARASVEARVSTEIPTLSTGRFVDAITDIFRPFSERRGLKADQIRLQREDVLLEIAQKARERLRVEGLEPSPIPNKFLVPFMEKASLEETGSPLIERWADLLASSSVDPDSAHPRFVQMLSEMTVDDAELLRKVAFHCIDEMRAPNQAFSDSPYDFQPKTVQEQLQNWLRASAVEIDDIFDHIIGAFERPGIFLLDVAVVRRNRGKKPEMWSIRTPSPTVIRPRNPANIEVLYSLSLLSDHSVEISKGTIAVTIYYVCITHLGVEFLKMCDSELNRKLLVTS